MTADRFSPGLAELQRQFDLATIAPLFPGTAAWPKWLLIGLTPLLNEPIDEHGNRMLHIAARSGNQCAIRTLMQLGADPAIMNHGEQTPHGVLNCMDSNARQAMTACLRRDDSSSAADLPGTVRNPASSGDTQEGA